MPPVIKPESFSADSAQWDRAVAKHKLKADTVRMERTSNGSWYYVIQMEIETKLKDGRKVNAWQELRIRAVQSGRVPHPNPFGKGRKK